MSLQAKYAAVIAYAQELGVQGLEVKEENGKFVMNGTAHTQYEKNSIWDKIKEVGGDAAADVSADIRVAETGYYHKHVVKKGESLSLIAKHYFEDPMKYKEIFEANRDTIKDPNLIHPDQEIIIPNL